MERFALPKRIIKIIVNLIMVPPKNSPKTKQCNVTFITAGTVNILFFL